MVGAIYKIALQGAHDRGDVLQLRQVRRFMLDPELVTTVTQLSFEQRLALLALLARSLRTDALVRETRAPSLARVRGMIKPDGLLPSDEELRDDWQQLSEQGLNAAYSDDEPDYPTPALR